MLSWLLDKDNIYQTDMSEINKICDRCENPMRLIPAGISKKTNKPYNAFWTCDKRNGGCGATAPGGDVETIIIDQPPGSNPSPSFGRPGGNNSDRLAAIEAKLDELIKLVKGSG